MIGWVIIGLMVWMILDHMRLMSGNPLGGMKEFYYQYWLSIKVTWQLVVSDIKSLFNKEK